MRTKIFAGAMIALLAVACAKEQLPVPKNTETGLVVTASVEQPGDGTKTSLDGLTVKWTEGDQICLKSADGAKTAIWEAKTSEVTTSFDKKEGDDFEENDIIYAYYPADEVTSFAEGAFTVTIPAVQAYKAGGFSDKVNSMTAKATVTGGNLALQFKNVFSYLKMPVSGCSAGKVLAGLSITSSTANLNGTATVSVGTTGIPELNFVSGTMTTNIFSLNDAFSSATPIYIAVPVGNLGTLTATAITAENDGCYSQNRVSGKTLVTERRNIYGFNEMPLSSFTADRTKISEPAANCYMVDGSSASTINIPLYQAIAGWNAVKSLEPDDTFDESEIVSGTRDINVRWFDGATGTITKTSIDDNVLSLSLAPDANGCNAVVDLMNDTKVVWSWHIWFTDYKPGSTTAESLNGQVHTYSGDAFKEGGLYYGKVMMDRNLGAVKVGVNKDEDYTQPTTDQDAVSYYGLFYQFGRKDPFKRLGKLTDDNLYDVSESRVTYAYAAQHPSKFFNGSNQGWSCTDEAYFVGGITDPWNSNGIKSAFDPCPAGWRIPRNGTKKAENAWSGAETSTVMANIGSTNSTCGFLWDCGDHNKVWLPTAGLRSYGNGSPSGGSIALYIWGDPHEATNAFYGNFNSTGKITTRNGGGGMRSYGMQIRCVKE